MHLPLWAKKPKHKKKVVPTKKGWVVESTGEVLVSHKNLDTKLKELFEETKEFLSIEQDFSKGTDVDFTQFVPEGLYDDVKNTVKIDFDLATEGDSTTGYIKTVGSEVVEDETESKQEEEKETEAVETSAPVEEKPKKKRGRPPKKK